jgi:hypothetical protein
LRFAEAIVSRLLNPMRWVRTKAVKQRWGKDEIGEEGTNEDTDEETGENDENEEEGCCGSSAAPTVTIGWSEPLRCR